MLASNHWREHVANDMHTCCPACAPTDVSIGACAIGSITSIRNMGALDADGDDFGPRVLRSLAEQCGQGCSSRLRPPCDVRSTVYGGRPESRTEP
ncbi:hypothetical protein BN2475_890002 [Paraburkholderia ribeironis]|uniref:Uncharacterized protein n=1 Tax=Paraburkholderia ribeironis TaxID=1247936 RepID=A0A1N7SM07_9BURK|nr:hypothetical protein BN2475_890002 [Paraburkholderia ribeironis]